MATPQQNLDAAYPGAADGVAVLDEASGDYWIKQSGIWINFGPVLGETINIDYDIRPYSEITSIVNSPRTSVKVASYPYSLDPVLTTIESDVYTSIVATPVHTVFVENPVILSLESYVPYKQNDAAYIFPGTTSLAVIPFVPDEIFSSLLVGSPKIITIVPHAPGTQAQVKINTSNPVFLIPKIPAVRNVVSPALTVIGITAFAPSKVGSFIAPGSIGINIIKYAPSVYKTIPTPSISILRYAPKVQVSPIVPTTFFEIRANKPDDGSGIIISSTIVTVSGKIPTVDAFPEIEETLTKWGSCTVKWSQPLDSYQIYGNNEQDVAAVNILGFQRMFGITSPDPYSDGRVYNGQRDYTIQRNGKPSGRWFRTQPSGAPFLPVNWATWTLSDSLINPVDYPWFGSYLPNVYHWTITSNGGYGLLRGKKDWCIEMFVYPESASFAGTAESASTPLLANVWYASNTQYYKGWDIHFRGSGSLATVYARFNDLNYATNPVAVVVSATSNNNFTANTWNYVAVARIADQIAINVNGQWGTPVSYTGELASIPGEQPLIGNNVFGGVAFVINSIGTFRDYNSSLGAQFTGDGNRFGGAFESLRFTKGEIPYTSFTNFSINPNTAPEFVSSIHKRTEGLNPYYVVSSFYEQNMWTWFHQVETYDASSLEFEVKKAINRFIIRAKKDGIWQSFTDCFVFVGPKTYNGALKIALYGQNPDEWHIENSIGNNFVTGDYDRKLGIKGDGVTKWIRTERVNNTFPTNNHHRAAWVTVPGVGPIFSGGIDQVGSTYVDWIPGYGGIRHGFVTNQRTTSGQDALVSSGGFVGFNRSDPNYYEYIVPGESGVVYEQSQTPWMEPVEILGASINQTNNYQVVSRGTHRLAFYSHGKSIDLKRLEQRVSQLLTELQAAIP
jgi:hypothetical protein